jgi:hypothetical protein
MRKRPPAPSLIKGGAALTQDSDGTDQLILAYLFSQVPLSSSRYNSLGGLICEYIIFFLQP